MLHVRFGSVVRDVFIHKHQLTDERYKHSTFNFQ